MHFNQKTLKLIAMITMFIDHTAVCFYYQLSYNTYTIMRGIGRLTFPIYIFLAIEAAMYTHSKKNYLLRLLLLACLAEVPFDLALFHTSYYPAYQNVIFTILFGVCACMSFTKAIESWHSSHITSIVCFVLTAVCLYLPELFQTDYGPAGAIAIFVGYLIKRYAKISNIQVKNVLTFAAAAVVLVLNDKAPEAMSLVTPVFAIPYNEKKGKLSAPEKWIYRLYYPAHLLLIWIIYYFTVYVNMPHASIG